MHKISKEYHSLFNQTPVIGHLDCFTFLGPSLQPRVPGVLWPWKTLYFWFPERVSRLRTFAQAVLLPLPLLYLPGVPRLLSSQFVWKPFLGFSLSSARLPSPLTVSCLRARGVAVSGGVMGIVSFMPPRCLFLCCKNGALASFES